MASKFCPNCGHELKPGARFCPNCGYRLRTATEPAPGSRLVKHRSLRSPNSAQLKLLRPTP